MTLPLDDDDRTLIRETFLEIQEAPAPRHRGPVGCVVALPGFVLLLVFPPAARILGVGSTVASVVVGAGIVLVVAGVAIWFGAGRFFRGHAIAASEAALRELEEGSGDHTVQLRAATLLLANARPSYAPTASMGFDIDEARRRLGEREALVRSVEEVLLEDGVMAPVFTAEDVGGDSEG